VSLFGRNKVQTSSDEELKKAMFNQFMEYMNDKKMLEGNMRQFFFKHQQNILYDVGRTEKDPQKLNEFKEHISWGAKEWSFSYYHGLRFQTMRGLSDSFVQRKLAFLMTSKSGGRSSLLFQALLYGIPVGLLSTYWCYYIALSEKPQVFKTLPESAQASLYRHSKQYRELVHPQDLSTTPQDAERQVRFLMKHIISPERHALILQEMMAQDASQISTKAITEKDTNQIVYQKGVIEKKDEV
jgi:hypothetical protein